MFSASTVEQANDFLNRKDEAHSLHDCIKESTLDVLKCLLDLGQPISNLTSKISLERSQVQWHAILFAAQQGKLDVLQYLANEKNCDINVYDYHEHDAFYFAVIRKRFNVLDWLIQNHYCNASMERIVDTLIDDFYITPEKYFGFLDYYQDTPA